ncbi:MAG: tetratricopeptide repeat protein [Okeania sp. SIO2C2]|uniref:tetratricopeptide repeat protein n=1 Tax=Okeania sp. SIO2C2 TaxID=2607787 RepID=UPI0013B9ACDC|nr:tetratricopeptide repeat protein [Okeania sp. SIO2C2]NEP86093.1 tetratricopeptide repeat protein [Okeania sp. SIO2C2]
MRISKTAVLTLAALSSQNLTANVDVLHNLGAILGKLHRYEEAIATFDRALKIQANKTAKKFILLLY